MKSIEEAQQELKEFINKNYEEYPYLAVYSVCSDDDELVLKSEKFIDQEIIGDSVLISVNTAGNFNETRCYYKVKMSRIPFRIYVITYNRDNEWVPYINNMIKVTAKYIEKPINSFDEIDELPTYLDIEDE